MSVVYLHGGDVSDADGYIAHHIMTKTLPSDGFDYYHVLPKTAEPHTRINLDNDDDGDDKDTRLAFRLLNAVSEREFTGVVGPRDKRTLIKMDMSMYEGVAGTGEHKINVVNYRHLANKLKSDDTRHIFLDYFGSVGFVEKLLTDSDAMISRMAPVVVMGGVLGEHEPITIRLPHRDIRSTANLFYYPPDLLFKSCVENDVPLVFITSNICRSIAPYDDDVEICNSLGITSKILRDICKRWYESALKPYGRQFVPFDLVALAVRLRPDNAQFAVRQMYLHPDDSSICVLVHPTKPPIPDLIDGLEYSGDVLCVEGFKDFESVIRDAMSDRIHDDWVNQWAIDKWRKTLVKGQLQFQSESAPGVLLLIIGVLVVIFTVVLRHWFV